MNDSKKQEICNIRYCEYPAVSWSANIGYCEEHSSPDYTVRLIDIFDYISECSADKCLKCGSGQLDHDHSRNLYHWDNLKFYRHFECSRCHCQGFKVFDLHYIITCCERFREKK